MNFEKKAIKQKKKRQVNEELDGIMNMKFMKNAEASKKDRLKEQAKMLVEQIKEDQRL